MADNNDKNKRQFFASAYYNSGEIGSDMTYEDFINALKSNPNLIRKVYAGLEKAKAEGKIKELAPISVIENGFGVTSSPTTETEVVAEEEVQTPQQRGSFPTPAELNKPIAPNQPLPNVGVPPSNQPLPTAEETQIAPINQQAGQVQGGMPISGDVLANAPQQQFQWSGQAPTQPVVQPQTGMPQTREEGAIQQKSVNPADVALSTLGSFETSLVSGIGGELKGISELGYSLDKKIVGALEGTPLEGQYAMLSKPEDSWIYQAGQGLQNFAEKDLYRNPEYQGGVADIVGQGLGSIAAISATGGLNPAGGIAKFGIKNALTNRQLILNGVKQFLSRQAIAGALMGVGQETDEARKLHRYANSVSKEEYVFNRLALGESQEDASKAYDKLKSVSEDEVASGVIPFALFSGATEAIPMERLFSRLGKASKDVVISAFKNGGIQAAEEALQEVIQQTISNVGKGQVYNEAQKLTVGLVESAEGGGATGFILGSILTLLAGKRANISKAVADGTMTKEEAIAELSDINKTQTLVNDKLQALDNKLLLTEGASRIAGLLPERTETKPADKKPIPMGGSPLPSSGKTIVTPSPYEVANLPEAKDFFDKNSPSETNVINSMPTSVESTLDKIAEGDIAVSAESLHEAYKWINDSFKQVISNQAISDAEKGATLNLLSNMLTEIDRGNTYLQETEAMLSEGMDVGKFLPEQKGKPLPQGQAPKGSVTPSISQAKAIREENRKKQAGTNVLPSSGQTIVTPAPATTEVATEAVTETPTGTTAEVEVKLAELPTKTIEAEVVSETPVAGAEANPALADVESTKDALINLPDAEWKKISSFGTGNERSVAEAYHKAKADNSNPKLVQAVEQLLTPTQDAVQKQTAGQVPVQSGTTSSQEVAKGEPQAEPKSTANKGQTQKEVKNESETTIQEKPLLEGVRDGGTETQTGQESTQLRTQETGKEELGDKVPAKKTPSTKTLDAEEQRRAVYKPGNKFKSDTGATFEVLNYNENPNDSTDWKVTTVKLDNQGNRVEGSQRTHSTSPSDTEYKRFDKQQTPTTSPTPTAETVATTTETAGQEGGAGNIETQIENFGVSKENVKPVSKVIGKVFETLKKAGLTTAKTVGDWVGIGKGEEKTYSLKINGKDTEVRNVSPEVVNGFYSPLEKTINETKLDKLPAKQWADKFGKSEEAKWTGLADWLVQQTGSVSKAEIQQFLKDNRIQVVEVVKGELGGDTWTKEGNSYFSKNREYEIRDLGEDGFELLRGKYNLGSVDSLEMAKENAIEDGYSNDKNITDDTKFSQYQLEGEKENYKEVLVTMPRKLKSEGRTIYSVYDKNDGSLIGEYSGRFAADAVAKRENGRVSESKREEIGYEDTSFKSTHFDEPNILVHLRMNTRTDADGNKVLFLEEVQSDWGQKGKKEGFKNISTEEYEQLREDRNSLTEQLEKPISDEYKRNLAIVKELGLVKDGEKQVWFHSKSNTDLANEQNIVDTDSLPIYAKNAIRWLDYSMQQTRSARKKLDEINTKLGSVNPYAVSSAPFVTDTNAWTKLGLKVALKEAVKQGATKIAWTTGEQQNDRYDLSKSVSKIEINKKGDNYEVKAYDKGDPVQVAPIREETVSEKELEGVVGKEIANKAINEGQTSFEGSDLKVGGKGMKGFYGSPTEGSLGIVGNVAKSLFKQEPKTTTILLDEKTKTTYQVINNINNSIVAEFNTGAEAQRYKNENEEIAGEFRISSTTNDAGKGSSTQHSIDITPELIASVEGGQPLFKDAQAQYRIENGKNIVEAIKDFNGTPEATVALTHEIMHPTVVSIIDGAKDGNSTGKKHTQTILSEYNKANPDNKVSTEELVADNDKFKSGETTDKYRAVQEFIAESWEKYHTQGAKGFSKPFQEVLDQITEAFKAVYKTISGKDITPELRQMFDEILGKETPTTESKPLTPVNATDVETITKIENATEKGRELALNKPTNKGLKRAFDNFQDLSDRARKAGIYDGKTLKIGGQEIELDTPAKFKAFLANQGNFDAISEAVKGVESERKTDTNPSPKTVEEKSKEVFNDTKSTFVFPIGLNPKFKFDSRLPENVVRFFKKYFRPRGLWTKGMFAAKRGMENQISAQQKRTEFAVKDLKQAVNKAYPKGITNEQLSAINDFLQGYARELPANLYKPIEKMREHIDELSRLMISEGIIDERLVPVFDANMGIYTTRTYAIHNDPEKWIRYINEQPEGQQIRNNAVNFVRQATEAKADRLDKFADENEKRAEKLFRRAELAEGDEALMLQAKADEVIARADRQRELASTMREQDFDAQIDAFLFAEGQPLDIIRKGNVGAKDLGVLKKRKNIPDEFRALMGEEKDPLTNYTMSVAKMSALIANNQFLNEVKAQGLASGLFSKKTPKGKNIVQIASASTDSMSPLNGLYTTKDIAEAFKEFDANIKNPWYVDAMLWVNAVVKIDKTVLSEQAVVRNFLGNPIIELANGYIPTFKGRAINTQMEEILNRRFGDKADVRGYIERLTKLGVLGQGGNYREIQAIYEDLKGNKYDYQKLIEPAIKKTRKGTWNILQKIYKGGDEFWKVVAFENERAVFEKAYGDTKTDEELDEMTATKIRRTRVDYSMAPKAVKVVNKFPFAGTFVTFPAEIIRIGANIPVVAYEEMNSGNKVLRDHGIKRMAGYMTAMTLSYGLSELTRYLAGMDDEEEEARKQFLAPWTQNSTLAWVDKNTYVDTGFSDAFSILKKPIVGFIRGADFVDGSIQAVKEFLGPLISEEIGYKTYESVKNNRDEYDNPIYDENAEYGTKVSQITSYVLKKVEPGTVSQIRRLYLGETGALSEKGQKYSTTDEVTNATFGIKRVTVDWPNAVSFKFRDGVEKINSSNKFFLKETKELRKNDVEGRRKAAESTNLAIENTYNDLRKYYTSALKIGMLPKNVEDIMRESGVSNELIDAVVNNTGYNNYLLILNDGTVLDRQIQRQLKIKR
jgi:hypothetical protein